MTDFLLLMLVYLIGVGVSAYIFHPMKNWQEGYDTDWDRGFDKGYMLASELFKDYDQGFGDGFEAGWDSALTQEGVRE